MLNSRYVVSKYKDDIDSLLNAVNNSDLLITGSAVVYKDYTYKSGDTTKSISQFYKAEIQYNKDDKLITLTEYMLDDSNAYKLIDSITLTVDKYNYIKSVL